jgi:hypothetical protein
MSLWNDLRQPAVRHPCPPLTPLSFKEDLWVRYAPTGTWFKLVVIDGDQVGGLDLHGSEVIVPWLDCHLAWSPPQEAGAITT